MPQNMMSMVKPRGLVEVVIDEQGRVVAMAMRQSLHPGYDALILNAARDWKYQPARYGGQPVRFRRLISVAVTAVVRWSVGPRSGRVRGPPDRRTPGPADPPDLLVSSGCVIS